MLPLLPLHIWSYIYRLAEKEAAATKLQAALRGLMQRRRRANLRYLVKYMAKGHDLDWIGMFMDYKIVVSPGRRVPRLGPEELHEWQSRGRVHAHHVPWEH